MSISSLTLALAIELLARLMIIWNWCIEYHLHFSQPPPLSVSAVRKGNASHAHTSMLYPTSPVSCYPSQVRSKMWFFLIAHAHWKFENLTLIYQSLTMTMIKTFMMIMTAMMFAIMWWNRRLWENFMACNKAFLFSMKITYPELSDCEPSLELW